MNGVALQRVEGRDVIRGARSEERVLINERVGVRGKERELVCVCER